MGATRSPVARVSAAHPGHVSIAPGRSHKKSPASAGLFRGPWALALPPPYAGFGASALRLPLPSKRSPSSDFSVSTPSPWPALLRNW